MAATTRAATAMTMGFDTREATAMEYECLFNGCAWYATITLPANLRISLMSFTSLHCRGANAGSSCARLCFGREMPHPYNCIYRNSKRTSTLPKRRISPSLSVRSSCGVKITPFNRVLFRALRSSTVYCPCWLRT